MSLALLSCAPAAQEPRPTRGLVLISLDTLRADRLGAYGRANGTSPFFDRLARSGTLFEHVAAPYPATLVSHMSMFTGLYPPQHGVYPPDGVLPANLATATELLRAAGYRTAAFTEGGFLARGYGFERGFETYDDRAYGADTDIEQTFARGLGFLRGLGDSEPFFLFLHTYSVHDPYDPPETFAGEFDGPEAAPDSSGERLRDFNLGRAGITPLEVERFSRRYDASVRYADSVLGGFVDSLREMGLLAESILLVTSDHGEEFLEHGKLAHTQLYPEVLAVPLLIVDPDRPAARRVEDQVSVVDLAPTLLGLAGLEPPSGWAGRSLVPYLGTAADPAPRSSYAELDDQRYLRTLIGEVGGPDGGRYQLLVEGGRREAEGTWLGERAGFDFFGSQLELRCRSFARQRRVSVRVEGEEVGSFQATPEWGEFTVRLPGTRSGWRRIELATDGCLRPVDLGEGSDERCLGVMVDGVSLVSVQLFDLARDPLALEDRSRDLPLVARRMLRELEERRWQPAGEAGVRSLSEEDRRRLRDLGYLD